MDEHVVLPKTGKSKRRQELGWFEGLDQQGKIQRF